MSILLDIEKDLSKLVSALVKYADDMKDAKDNLNLKNKNLQTACIEQSAWGAYYDQIRVELETITDFMEMKVKQVRSTAMQEILKHSKLAYSDRQLDKLVDSDPKYIKMNMLYLETKELHLKSKSIVEMFTQRGYSLNNIVKVRVALLEDVILVD